MPSFTGTTGSAAHCDIMMRRHLIALFVTSIASVGIAHAEPSEAPSGTLISLTPAQVEAAKEAAAERNLNRPAALDTNIVADRRPHGEVGIAVGTGGYRSIYGSTVMPLGKNGSFAFSFEKSQNDPYLYGYGYGPGSGYRQRH